MGFIWYALIIIKRSEGYQMKQQWGEKTIGSIVAVLPAAAGVFKIYGVDYCCGGQRVLSGVLSEQHIDEAELYAKLDEAYEQAQRIESERDFNALSAGDLVQHIESTHHAYLREALPQISELFGTVLRAHGQRHPELFDLHRVYSRLRGDLEQHLVKEEAILFPSLIEEPSAETKRLSKEIKAEHDEAGNALKELRRISGDYKAPSDACATFAKLYEALERMEDDLHKHVHLENNILLLNV